MVLRMRRAEPGDVDALESLQRAAFAENRVVLGREPIPLLSDYMEIVATKECLLAGEGARLDGALILEPDDDGLMIWSIAVAPHARGGNLGRAMMAHAEDCARDRGLAALVLYTGEKLTKNIAWYERLGFAITRIEALADRNIVHMRKPVAARDGERA